MDHLVKNSFIHQAKKILKIIEKTRFLLYRIFILKIEMVVEQMKATHLNHIIEIYNIYRKIIQKLMKYNQIQLQMNMIAIYSLIKLKIVLLRNL